MIESGDTLRIAIRDDLVQLYQAVIEARGQSNERDAYAALGRFFYERMQELEAEHEERGQYREYDAWEDPDDVL